MDEIAIAVKGGFAGVQKGSSEMESEIKSELKAGFDEMRGGFQKTDVEMKQAFDETKRKIDGVKDAVDNTGASVQEILSRLKSLQAADFPYPHHVIVREVGSRGAASKSEGAIRRTMRRLRAQARGKVFKEMTLHFLCSADMSEVPCGYGGEGFRFSVTRDWAKKLSPVLQVGRAL